MIFAHEDILNQKPIAWFPGMAGSCAPSKEDCKSDWNRFESQASTVPPDPAEHYMRSISSDSAESERPKQCRLEEEESDETKAILNLEEYDDESASLLQDFGFEGNFASWTREMTESAGFVGSAFLMLLVVLSLASAWSSTAGSMCFALVKVVLIVACLSGFCMHQLQPVKAYPEASPYTTEGTSS
ncbi:unnamed protein product [Symbiodinium sp. CCMP2592]|nr:unnamed protein product [Symbiodinium sp. CCMP2592]